MISCLFLISHLQTLTIATKYYLYTGGVRRLKDICINFVKQNLGYYDLALIPPVLKRELLQENIELYTVYYYHEIAI